MNLRHCIFVLSFVFCIDMLYAQEWLWAVNAGGAASDEAFSTATDKEGNIYLTGYFGPDGISFGNTSLTNRGNYDIFIAKYNPDGEPIWARSAGGTGNDFGFSITVDPTGNICLTGTFENDSIHIGSTSLENLGGYDVFMAKYDELGNLLWAKSAGGAESDQGYGITTDSEANIYITGQLTSSSIQFDQTTIFNSSVGFSEIFLAKFDAGGNIQWGKTAAGSNNDIAYSIASGGSDDLYITGFFRSLSIGFDQVLLLNSAPAREMFIAKYSTGGDILWAKRAGGELNDLAYSVNRISDEIVAVTGSFRSDSIIFGNTVLKNTQVGALNFFVAQYDSSGQVIAAAGGGGLYDDHGFCAAADHSNSLFLAGGYLSQAMILENDTLMNSGDSTFEMFILKYGPAGNILWSESIGGSEDDYINWMKPDASNHIYVVGYFGSSAVQFGKTTLQNNGGGDLFIAKLSSFSVAVHEINWSEDKLLVYPNPASGSFTVELRNSMHSGHMELYNSMGQKLFHRNFFGKEIIKEGLDFQAIPGVYFIRVLEGRNQYFEKLVIF